MILSNLGFDVNQPTAATFLENYSVITQTTDIKVLTRASFFIDLLLRQKEYI